MQITLITKCSKSEIKFINEPFEYLKSLNRNMLIITDENLHNIYKKSLTKFTTFILPVGEVSKDIEYIVKLEEFASKFNIDKSSLIVAFGGGTVGDVAGFFASIYKRGIEFINVPTTLLSMVDSSLGGKNGVNTTSGKNQLGSIYQPTEVIIDIKFLSTLPEKEYLNGYGEIVKYAFISTSVYQLLLRDEIDIPAVIDECIKTKVDIVSIDEYDSDVRKILNLGHTFGHAIEFICKIDHGLAILYGLEYELNLKMREILKNILTRLRITLEELSIDNDELIAMIKSDKKVQGNIIQVPIVEDIGKVSLLKVELIKFYEDRIFKKQLP